MWWKRSQSSASETPRTFLFGDVGMGQWPPDEGGDYPWTSFLEARRAWASGDRASAVTTWMSVAHDDSVEARHRLQAWHFLRAAQVQPPQEEASHVLGAVAEVPVGRGHDVLVAYADGTARYLNHAGGAAVIEGGAAPPLADAVRSWFDTAHELAARVGVWDRDELPPLPSGHTRVLMLTPGGFRFGQGPDDQLRGDPAAAQYLARATDVLVAITRQMP